MGIFGEKKPDEKPPAAKAPPPAASKGEGPRVGIDHAITLLRSLPTEKNATLVVTVLKTTLESLGIRVADIVADASKRLQQLEGRTSQLKSEIAALEQEIAKRTEEIGRMETAHAEVAKVKEYLAAEEAEEAEIIPNSKP
jgi:hypothetical protein